jgi:tellurite methyltransferase
VYDISEVGIEKIRLINKEKGLDIKTKVLNITEEGIDYNYDVIINTFVLHHLSSSDAKKLIYESKKNTNKGGVNIIVTFSKQGDLYERAKKSERFYPDEEMIRELYSDWDIKELNNYETKTLAKDKKGEIMKNYVISLIAIKN